MREKPCDVSKIRNAKLPVFHPPNELVLVEQDPNEVVNAEVSLHAVVRVVQLLQELRHVEPQEEPSAWPPTNIYTSIYLVICAR